MICATHTIEKFSKFASPLKSSKITSLFPQMRVLWVDASVNDYTVVIRPGNWMSLPPGDDDDLELDEI